MPGSLVMSALASHSCLGESVRACVRPVAKYAALLALGFAPALASAGPAPASHNTVYGGIGYSLARGAPALYFVPVAANNQGPPIPVFAPLRFPPAKATPAPKSKSVGKVKSLDGTVTIMRNGVTRPLTDTDQIQVGDTLTTGSNGYLSIHLSQDANLSMGENTKITVNKDFFDQAHPARSNALWTWLQGVFEWTSSQIGKDRNTQINGPVDGVGIRGTQFIARYDAKRRTMDIELISGSVTVKPKRSGAARTFAAPVRIRGTATSVTGFPLTREQYKASKAAWLSP